MRSAELWLLHHKGEPRMPFQRIRIEMRGLTQLNLTDPNGLKVELTFSDLNEGPPAPAK